MFAIHDLNANRHAQSHRCEFSSEALAARGLWRRARIEFESLTQSRAYDKSRTNSKMWFLTTFWWSSHPTHVVCSRLDKITIAKMLLVHLQHVKSKLFSVQLQIVQVVVWSQTLWCDHFLELLVMRVCVDDDGACVIMVMFGCVSKLSSYTFCSWCVADQQQMRHVQKWRLATSSEVQVYRSASIDIFIIVNRHLRDDNRRCSWCQCMQSRLSQLKVNEGSYIFYSILLCHRP